MPDLATLPENPDYQQACALLDDQPLSYWLPVLEHLRQHHQLPAGDWQRIKEGGNALFSLGDGVIVKLVPPNWRAQGLAEIAAAEAIPPGLSLATPQLLASGELNNWVYVVMSRLPGICLADVWPELSLEQKRPLIRRVGQLMRELRQLPVPAASTLLVDDWPGYIAKATADCMDRHRRCEVPAPLLDAVMPYLAAAGELGNRDELHFIHMDLHPWNLMAVERQGEWQLSGLLDFGDAVIGRSALLEIATPALFMAQGNRELLSALLDAYGCQDCSDPAALARDLMATSLIRPCSDITFVMAQVPISGPRDSWQQVAAQLFPL